MGLTSNISDATTLFLLLAFLFFDLESDEDVSDNSDDEGYGSGFSSVSCVSPCFELSVDRVS